MDIYNKELDRLEKLQQNRQATLNKKLIQETMYNLFDKNIVKWTDYYNSTYKTKLEKDPLDANMVKAMIYQETEMGTAGEHMFANVPSTGYLLKTRYNVIQAIDSAAFIFLLIFEEQKLDLLTKYNFKQMKIDLEKAKDERNSLLKNSKRTLIQEERLAELNDLSLNGKNWDNYYWKWSFGALLKTVKELAESLGGGISPDELNNGIPFDYDFWIRMGIRWLFEKRLSTTS